MNDVKEYLKFWKESADGQCMPLSSDELNNEIRTISDSVSTIKKSLYYDNYIKCNVDGDYYLTEKGLKLWKTIDHKREVQSKSVSKGNEWTQFRNLLTYYIECIKQEERPSHIFYPNNENTKFFIPEKLVSSWLRELSKDREKYELNIKFKKQNINAIHRFKTAYDEDNVVYLGYPILATKSNNGNVLYYPIGLVPLNVNLESSNLRNSMQNTISFDVNYLEATINFALLDYYIPQERRKGFLHSLKNTHIKDEYVGLFDLYRSLPDIQSELGNREVDDELDPLALSQFLPKNINIKEHELCNTAVIYTVDDLRFNRVLAKELQYIRDEVSDNDLDKTSLAYIYRNPVLEKTKIENRIGINFIQSNYEQLMSIEHAINQPCTKITGPPGTGKSQVATNIIANSVFYGDTVLFASKNHKAINAIRERTNSIFKDIDENLYLTEFCHDEGRTLNNPWYRKDIEVSIASKSISTFDKNSLYEVEKAIDSVDKYRTLFEIEQNAKNHYYNCKHENNELNKILSQALYLDEIRINLNEKDYNQLMDCYNILIKDKYNFFEKIFLKKKLKANYEKALQILKDKAPNLYEMSIKLENKATAVDKLNIIKNNYTKYINSIKKLDESTQKLKAKTNNEIIHDNYDKEYKKIEEKSKNAFWVKQKEKINEYEENDIIVEDIKDLSAKYKNKDSIRIIRTSLDEYINADIKKFNQFLKIHPSWATTLLSIKYTSPCFAGIFDLVIIDEAAQCDCISIIPALFRSKRVAVMGDPAQLPPIVTISQQRHDFLWDRMNLNNLDRYSYYNATAYSVIPAKAIMLKEHYRCDPQIAQIFSESFYNNELRIKTDVSKLNFPKNCGFRNSVEWIDVKNDFEGEIQAAISHVKILQKNKFSGTVGIISPLKVVIDKVNEKLLKYSFDENKVMAKTIAAFQGAECDIIIFITAYNDEVINQRGKLWYITDTSNNYIYNVAISRARALLLFIGDYDKCKNSKVRILEKITKTKNIKLQNKYDAMQDCTTSQEMLKKTDETKIRFDSDVEKVFFKKLLEFGIATVPQYPLAERRLDLAYFDENIKLDIEIDGATYHTDSYGNRKLDDNFRDLQVSSSGWVVQRFWAKEIFNDIDKCVEKIKDIIGLNHN